MMRWVVTDLDGTLLDHNYSWEPARSTISTLKQQGVLVIPCTSKTAEEVRSFRQDAGLSDPFIVENGGAIYGNNADDSEWVVPLGAAHSVLRPQLDELSQALGHELVALEDLSAQQGEALTGLRGEALASAQRREWSVPFLTAPEALREPLNELSAQHELLVVQGNRMSHLLSGGSHKGRAVEVLKQHLQQPDVVVLGLGDSPNDWPMLEAVDQAVVVPGPQGPHPVFQDAIANGRFQLAPAPHGEGWALAVNQWLNS
jgi:mannosyl-3-phosphoglycerate phosphatase